MISVLQTLGVQISSERFAMNFKINGLYHFLEYILTEITFDTMLYVTMAIKIDSKDK